MYARLDEMAGVSRKIRWVTRSAASLVAGHPAFCLLAAVVVYAALVGAGVLPRYDGLLFLALCACIAHVRQPTGARRAALYIGFFGIVTVGGLLNMWWSYGGVVDRQGLLGDVIPWSDAGGFLSDATRRNYGLLLSQGARRPIYLVVLSALLRVSGNHVRAVVALMALAGSVMGGLVAARIAERACPWGVALALAIIYSFVRRHAFALSTESLGFIFGSAAFLVMFRSGPSALDLFAGTILFALGLATRMGPLFVVGTTVVCFAIRRQYARAAMVACAWALVLGADAWLIATIREPGVAMGDYGPILYGMLHGEDFTFITTAHPEVSALPMAERGSAILRIVLSELGQRPMLAIVGPVRSLASFLFLPHGLLSLVLYDPDDIHLESPLPAGRMVFGLVGSIGAYRVISYVTMLLAACACTLAFVYALGLAVVRRPSESAERLCRYVFLGVVLSSAFTPPWITEGEQLQSSTLPFVVAFAACSIGNLGAQARRPAPRRAGFAPPVWAFGALVAVAGSAFFPARWAQSSPPCPGNATPSALFAQAMSGTRVEVSRSNSGYSMERVRTNAMYLSRHYADLGAPLLELAAPGMAFEVVYDRCEERTQVVAASAELLTRWRDRWATADVERHQGILRVIRIREFE
jgi:hypothetical protein